MAVTMFSGSTGPVLSFDDWYIDRGEDYRTGCLTYRNFDPRADDLYRLYGKYKSEHMSRVANYYKLEKLVDAEVLSTKPDLPNISSGETAGLIRRVARNVVQNTPNVEIISKFDETSVYGVFSRYALLEKIIGSDQYSNDMQQNLFATTKSSLTLGFQCVVPVLTQDSGGGWYIHYDSINYMDVFPEQGAKDIRQANDVFIRRWLTKKDILGLIRNQVSGWDLPALKELLKSKPFMKESASQQEKRHRKVPEGYELITWYSNTGDPFLTFSAQNKTLLRIEQNKHPLKQHPVHFLVMEKDENQPLGKSQVELVLGRQDFQDLMLNGAMKLWYRNINPSIITRGPINGAPNLSPGKHTNIPNPNTTLETVEVNTQTLMQYNSIAQANMGAMVNLIGAADQQMAMSAGNGMSATPAGVEAQEALVDITTNNYQKAVEAFFSHYCSYALTIYFQELKSVKTLTPSADARQKLVKAGLDPKLFDPDTGVLKMSFSDLAVEYFVRCIPGSLTELEDEKQLRILNQLFVPLSQAMPALAATNNPEILANAALAMQYIIRKEIELSGSMHSNAIQEIMATGVTPNLQQYDERAATLEENVSGYTTSVEEQLDATTEVVSEMREQIKLLSEGQASIIKILGGDNQTPEEETNTYSPVTT